MNPRKILILCKKVPYPSTDGESIVIMSDIEALRGLGFEVHVFCLNTRKHCIDTTGYHDMKLWESYTEAKISTNSYVSSVIKSIIHGTPFHLERFYSIDCQNTINNIVQTRKIDAVICQGLAMTLYTKELSQKADIFYRMHNIESNVWHKLAHSANDILRRYLYKSIARSLHKFEKLLPNYLKIISISQAEQDRIRESFGLESTFISIYLASEPTSTYNAKAEGILFVGSLDWLPNLQGLDWFLSEGYPHISDIPLTIAGKGEYSRNQLPKGVTILENFQSIETLFSTHRLMIIPLLSGAGIRIKIIEGIQFGIPILSTSIGAEGLFVDNSIIRLEDDPVRYATVIKELYYQKSILLEMSQKERFHYQMNHSEKKIKELWTALFESNRA